MTSSGAPDEQAFTTSFISLPGAAGHGETSSAPPDVVVEWVREHVVRPGDSLALLAARHGVSAQEIARRNGLGAYGTGHDRPAADGTAPESDAVPAGLAIGRRLSILARHVVPSPVERGVIVNIPQRMLYRFEDGRLVGAWPVAVGRPGWETPVTEFRIINRLQDPVWYVPRSVQAEMRREGKPVLTMVEPGPDNPLGGYWLGIDQPGFGFHATNEEDSGYRFASHGCVRLHPEDMAVFFPQIRVGDRGSFIYRPVLLARSADGRIWLEANPDAYGRGEESVKTVRELVRQQGLDPLVIDWSRVASILDERSGLAAEITRSRRFGGGVRSAAGDLPGLSASPAAGMGTDSHLTVRRSAGIARDHRFPMGISARGN